MADEIFAQGGYGNIQALAILIFQRHRIAGPDPAGFRQLRVHDGLSVFRPGNGLSGRRVQIQKLPGPLRVLQDDHADRLGALAPRQIHGLF